MAFVGIDISKAKMDVCIRAPQGASEDIFTLDRDAKGVASLMERLAPLCCVRIVCEATGGFEIPLVTALRDAGLPIVVANPRQVRQFARAAGMLAKTDSLDAKIIARFGEALMPEIRPLADENGRFLNEIVGRRRQLTAMIVAEGNRRAMAQFESVRARITMHMDALRAELKELDAEITRLVRAAPDWLIAEQRLTSVPCVGLATARTLIAELPELGTLDRRRIAALVGLAPIACESGLSKGYRAIRGGRPVVRSALYMAALVGCRRNPILKAFYEKLRAAGKAAKAAVIAAARKLLTILNAMMRDKKEWGHA
jgi:transposase